MKTMLNILIAMLVVLGPSEENSYTVTALSDQEQELYRLIMDYRQRKGLESIRVSPSLTHVARVHARDLAEHRPFDERCNLHSWSDQGDWTACCYTDDHEEANCMWYKPYELTGFRGIGYEIVYYSTYPEDHRDFPSAVLEGWKNSKSHNQVIINRGDWRSMDWKSIGISVQGPFAVVWFSDSEDHLFRVKQKQ
jgi:uncharacterized protein YkwD